MKKTTPLFLFALLLLFTCERDDICSDTTPTTPHFIVEFRDITNPDNTKTVTGLRIEDADNATSVLTNYNDVNDDQMFLPLKTDADVTQFRVYKDYNVATDGTIEGNDDVITITYAREDVYVSRACGYKTTYKNISITIEPDADNWMLFEEPINDNQTVINEDEVHFTIRH